MNIKDFKFKLKWWAKEHLLFYKSPLINEEELIYSLPDNYGDYAVHPCVRYIEEGIGGYPWWMVLSPYPHYDTEKENVLLFRGKVSLTLEPPLKWEFVKEVCGTHPKGFNSDPNLFYDGKSLWVVWREWETENLPSGVSICCTMCSKTVDGVNFSSHEVIAHNEFKENGVKGDTSMCPIVCVFQGTMAMYASKYAYKPYLRPMGTSRYLFNEELNRFCLEYIYYSDKVNFDLWHFDLFEYKGYLYQIITGQFGNAIYIGRSEDGIVFKYSKRPLYSYPWFLKKNFFYKPTAQIVNNKLYVFFPRKKGKGILRIVMRSMEASILDSFEYQ